MNDDLSLLSLSLCLCVCLIFWSKWMNEWHLSYLSLSVYLSNFIRTDVFTFLLPRFQNLMMMIESHYGMKFYEIYKLEKKSLLSLSLSQQISLCLSNGVH